MRRLKNAWIGIGYALVVYAGCLAFSLVGFLLWRKLLAEWPASFYLTLGSLVCVGFVAGWVEKDESEAQR